MSERLRYISFKMFKIFYQNVPSSVFVKPNFILYAWYSCEPLLQDPVHTPELLEPEGMILI